LPGALYEQQLTTARCKKCTKRYNRRSSKNDMYNNCTCMSVTECIHSLKPSELSGLHQHRFTSIEVALFADSMVLTKNSLRQQKTFRFNQ